MDIMKIQNKGISQLKEEAVSLRFMGLFFGVIGLISLMISGYFFLIGKNTQSIIFIVLYFLTLLFLIELK